MAKTPKGRAMQDYAEMVTQEADDTMGPDSGEYLKKQEHINRVATAINDEGEIREDLGQEELKKLRKALGDVILSAKPDIRKTQLETTNSLLTVIDERLAVIAEAKTLADAPDKIAACIGQLNACIKETQQAVNARNWKTVNHLNRQGVEITRKIRNLLNFVRAKDPDFLASMVNHIEESNPYKSVLIDYVASHNSFQWSPDIMEHLQGQAKWQARRNPNGKTGFYDALLSAYAHRPAQDNEKAFLHAITRIPKDRLEKIL